MKFCYFFTLLVLIAFFSKAQSNYKNGYIISLAGDTTKGYIDYKEWARNPRTISFKSDLNGEKRILGVGQLNSFLVTRLEYYKRYILPISLDHVDIGNVHDGIDTTSRIDTVFLHVLESGKNVTLFSYNDEIKTRFYIAKVGSDKVQELVFRVYQDTENNSNLITNTDYKRQLNYFASAFNVDLPEMQQQISQANYAEKDLIKVVAKINGVDIKSEYLKRNKSGARFFAGAALNLSSLNFKGDAPFDGKSASSVLPKVSVGLDGFFNPNVGDLVYRIELSFTMNSFTDAGASTDYHSTDNSVEKLQRLTITATPQLLYNFYNTEPLKVFFGVGVCMNYSTDFKNQYTVNTTPLGSSQATSTTTTAFATQAFTFSAMAKLGVVLNKHLEIYGGYTLPTTITDYIYFSGTITNYQVGINYLFGHTKKK